MISNDVVILTADEHRNRLEKEFRRGIDSTLDDRATLHRRAALADHDLGVVYSTDGAARVHVAQAFETGLGDCLTLRWHPEVNNPRRLWYTAHFSPARARLIARELLRRAALLEEANGLEPIDPIPEKMRLGPVGDDRFVPPITDHAFEGGSFGGGDQGECSLCGRDARDHARP